VEKVVILNVFNLRQLSMLL